MKNVLQQTSQLVLDIGEFKLNNGLTIKENLIYDEVNLWEMAQPDLALHILPKILFEKNGFIQNRINYFTFRLKNIKYFLDYIYNNFNSRFESLYVQKNTWLFLGFSNYIFRDTLLPILDFVKEHNKDINFHICTNIYKKKERKIGDLIGNISQITKEIHKIKSFKYNFYELIENTNFQQLNNINKKQINILLYWILNIFLTRNIINIKYAKFTIRSICPQILISADMASPKNRIFNLIAKKDNIPSLEVQFGLYDESSVEWSFCFSDYIALWGYKFKNLFNDVYKISNDKLTVTGSPRFDYILKNKETNNKSLKSGQLIVLFASMYTEISDYDQNYNVQIIDDFKINLINELTKNTNLLIYIKPHPLENLKWLKKCSLNNKCIILDKTLDIRTYINLCDIFFTFGSTSTFDAILHNKYVFSANIEGLVWWDDIFLKEKITYPINSYEDLKVLIKNMDINFFYKYNKIDIRSFMNEYVYFNTKTSSELIIQLAQKIISERN